VIVRLAAAESKLTKVSDMNYGRGFFRLWAVITAFWLAIAGIFAYGSLKSAYETTLTRDSFTFTDAGGRTITVISPTRDYASEYVKELLKPGAKLQAPDCNDERNHCKPSDRDWGGLKLLAGASLDPDRVIVGPFLIEDRSGFDAAQGALRSVILTSAILCFGVPIVIGAGIVAVGWIVRGFRAT
jgi:hypothetical protein